MKFLLLHIFWVAITLQGYSQVDEKSIIGTWQIISGRYCVGSYNGYQDCKDATPTYNQTIFFVDHTCIVRSVKGKKIKASWELRDSIIFITSKRGPFNMRVSEVNSDRMEVEFFPAEEIYVPYKIFITLARKE